jgi:hypothetical protein
MSSYDGYAPYVEDESVLLTHQGYSTLLANRDARIAQLEANFTKLEASLARYKECLRKFFASTAPDCGAIYRDGLKRALEDCYALYAEERGENQAAPAETAARRERTPQEEAEWLEDKRAEYDADRICGHHWGNR